MTEGGEWERIIVPKEKIRPIDPKVIEPLDRGYIAVSGDKEVSSTQIRARIKSDEEIDELVGPRVAEVIQRHALYKVVPAEI